MRPTLFALMLFSFSFFSSCSKETVNYNSDVIGNWTWTSSYSSAGAQMLSNDPTIVYSIRFNNDNSFINNAGCVIGGFPEGNYQVQNCNNVKTLTLKSGNISQVTFNLSVSSDKLILTETNNGYSWNHSFSKSKIN